MSKIKRVKLEISGLVQGVGFRPFVSKKATELKLGGFVRNSGLGVEIELEGNDTNIETFIQNLHTQRPSSSHIQSIKQSSLKLQDKDTFFIKETSKQLVSTQMPLDKAICQECQDEFNDPNNRRFNDPFISCNACGPRYTMIKALPYDRASTSMAEFPLCKACQSEYDDPKNRRFHTQAMCCKTCGPQLTLLNGKGETVAQAEKSIKRLALEIKKGEIVALKGLGGFHLLCNAHNEKAVAKLRTLKRRAKKPLAVMVADLNSAQKIAHISKEDEAVLNSKESPIVILKRDKNGQGLASNIAFNSDKIALLLPYTPLHLLLLKALEIPIVITSANLSQEPIITEKAQLLEQFGSHVSAILSHDREIIHACEDSVVIPLGKELLQLRSARGFTPQSFHLDQEVPQKILALGGHHKSSFALAFGQTIITSPYLGDLGTIKANEHFEKNLQSLQSLYGFKPDLIVCDKHPEYETTTWAQESKLPILQVQHHYAHALACMAEHHLDEEVLAFCFDGTGFGDDGSLWGGELLIANRQNYQRMMHLRPFKLLGADKAIKEPRRIALSLLFECFSLEEVLKLDSPTMESFSKEEIMTLHHMWEKDINAPQTSSIGRLFDAIASFSGLVQKLDYEGESGLGMETAASAFQIEDYFDHILTEDTIDWEPMLRELLQLNIQHIPSLFINMLIEIISQISQKHPHLPVILCGGVFQNQLLVSQLILRFKKLNIRYYIQEKTSLNDGSLALGQIYHAIHKVHSHE